MGARSCLDPQSTAASCPRLQPALGCPGLRKSPAVEVSPRLVTLQPRLCSQVHIGGFCTQILLCSGMLLPASAKQFLPCHLQHAPWVSCHKFTRGTSGAVGGGIGDPWVTLKARGWSEVWHGFKRGQTVYLYETYFWMEDQGLFHGFGGTWMSHCKMRC